MVDWESVRVFVAVTRLGSMRKAARELGLDASTVSRRIAALEDTVGSALLERHAGGLSLTDAGVELRDLGERMETDLKRFTRSVGDRVRGHRGTVRLSYPLVLSSVLPAVVRDLAQRWPGLLLDLDPGDRSVDLVTGEADLVLRCTEAPDPDLFGVRAGAIEVGVYVGPAASCPDPAAASWVDWGDGHSRGPAARWVDERFPKRKVVLRASSGVAVSEAVRGGVGIAMLPRLMAEANGCVEVVPLPESTWPTVWLLCARASRDRVAIRTVMTALREALSARLVRRSPEGRLSG